MPCILVFAVLLLAVQFVPPATSVSSQLSALHYEHSCPDALIIVRSVVGPAVRKQPRLAASLLRVFGHDCLVKGCDASILLDSPSSISDARAFDVVDDIKSALEKECPKIVSCADILAIAAREAVVLSGGPTWKVPLGRRDSTTASWEAPDANIPTPKSNISQIFSFFKDKDLDAEDVVALLGGHSIGYAPCVSFRDRIYNDSNIDPSYAQQQQSICPRHGGDSNPASLDNTPRKFDTIYYSNLVQNKGLLHCDQGLYNASSFATLVEKYSYDTASFFQGFAIAMIKLGNINPLTGDQGEIRDSCRKLN